MDWQHLLLTTVFSQKPDRKYSIPSGSPNLKISTSELFVASYQVKDLCRPNGKRGVEFMDPPTLFCVIL